MSKVEQLRKCLQAKRKELNAKGLKYIPGESKLMDCKPFEIAYQDCIETLWPEEPWWKTINYWDIFDAMIGGLSDEEVIDEICNHVAPEFLKEGAESAKIEDGHSYEEYMDKFGRAYQDGELWDFSEEDFKGGAIEINPEITYWKIEVEGEPRYFETLGECKEACHKEKKSLDEGTSNFPTRFPHGFPLLVFYTIDEVYDMMSNDSDYPEESDFEDEDGNVDENAYWEAREKFEQDYWDKIDCCILDESQVDELEDKLYDFNQETKSIAYDADVGEDGYQQYSDKLSLEDVELKIEPGYYEAAYIDVDHEEYLDGIEEGEWKEAQIKRIKDFMQSLVEEFGLSEYEVAWGPASNGETGYRKVKKQEERLTPKNEGYTLLGKEDKEILAFSNYNNAVKKAEELGLKLAEYGDVYGSNVSYAFWNKSGNRNDDEEVICYYLFGKDGKPRADVTRTELNQIAKAFGIPESDIDDAEEAVDDDVVENMYDGKKGGNKGSIKTKVHVNKNAGNPKRNMEIFNHMMGSDAPAVSTGVALGESAEGKVEFCLMSDGDNVDCYTSEEEAIKSAEEYYNELKNRNLKKNVRVLKVTYGPENEVGDSEEQGLENIWDSGDIDGHYYESLKEGKKEDEVGAYSLFLYAETEDENAEDEMSDISDELTSKYLDSLDWSTDTLDYKGCKKLIKELAPKIKKAIKAEDRRLKDANVNNVELYIEEINGSARDSITVWRASNNESLKEEKEYLSDKVTKVLDDYGILYGDIVENGDGTVNIVGVDEEEWDEVVEAIEAELGLDVLVPDSDHGEFDDELIVRECLKEASSALKKAYRNGGDDYNDLIQGRAIARIKDPKSRAAAVAAAKAGRKDIVPQFTGKRKEDQAVAALDKKQGQMAKAGLKEEESSLTKKIKKVISAWLKKQGYEESDLELFVIKEKPYEDGEGHKANHVQIRNDLVGFYEADELISELDKLVEPGYFEPDYDTVWDAYIWEIDEEVNKKYAEFKQWLKGE